MEDMPEEARDLPRVQKQRNKMCKRPPTRTNTRPGDPGRKLLVKHDSSGSLPPATHATVFRTGRQEGT